MAVYDYRGRKLYVRESERGYLVVKPAINKGYEERLSSDPTWREATSKDNLISLISKDGRSKTTVDRSRYDNNIGISSKSWDIMTSEKLRASDQAHAREYKRIKKQVARENALKKQRENIKVVEVSEPAVSKVEFDLMTKTSYGRKQLVEKNLISKTVEDPVKMQSRSLTKKELNEYIDTGFVSFGSSTKTIKSDFNYNENFLSGLNNENKLVEVQGKPISFITAVEKPEGVLEGYSYELNKKIGELETKDSVIPSMGAVGLAGVKNVIDTGVGIKTIVTHPVKTSKAVYGSVVDFMKNPISNTNKAVVSGANYVKNNPERTAGIVASEILMAKGAGGVISKISNKVRALDLPEVKAYKLGDYETDFKVNYKVVSKNSQPSSLVKEKITSDIVDSVEYNTVGKNFKETLIKNMDGTFKRTIVRGNKVTEIIQGVPKGDIIIKGFRSIPFTDKKVYLGSKKVKYNKATPKEDIFQRDLSDLKVDLTKEKPTFETNSVINDLQQTEKLTQNVVTQFKKSSNDIKRVVGKDVTKTTDKVLVEPSTIQKQKVIFSDDLSRTTRETVLRLDPSPTPFKVGNEYFSPRKKVVDSIKELDFINNKKSVFVDYKAPGELKRDIRVSKEFAGRINYVSTPRDVGGIVRIKKLTPGEKVVSEFEKGNLFYKVVSRSNNDYGSYTPMLKKIEINSLNVEDYSIRQQTFAHEFTHRNQGKIIESINDKYMDTFGLASAKKYSKVRSEFKKTFKEMGRVQAKRFDYKYDFGIDNVEYRNIEAKKLAKMESLDNDMLNIRYQSYYFSPVEINARVQGWVRSKVGYYDISLNPKFEKIVNKVKGSKAGKSRLITELQEIKIKKYSPEVGSKLNKLDSFVDFNTRTKAFAPIFGGSKLNLLSDNVVNDLKNSSLNNISIKNSSELKIKPVEKLSQNYSTNTSITHKVSSDSKYKFLTNTVKITDTVKISTVKYGGSVAKVPELKIPIPKTPKIDLGLESGFENVNKKTDGYNVYMIEGKKKVKANLSPLPKKEAHRLGMDIAENSLSASYKVSKSNSKVPISRRRKLATGNFVSPGNFRASKSSKNFLVEKRKHRLNSVGEKKGITASRLIGSLKKKKTKRLF